jgi:hypothetical protein
MCICITTTTTTTYNKNALCLARQDKVEKDTAKVSYSAMEMDDTAMVSPFSASEMDIFEEELNCITAAATAYNKNVLCLARQFSVMEIDAVDMDWTAVQFVHEMDWTAVQFDELMEDVCDDDDDDDEAMDWTAVQFDEVMEDVCDDDKVMDWTAVQFDEVMEEVDQDDMMDCY